MSLRVAGEASGNRSFFAVSIPISWRRRVNKAILFRKTPIEHLMRNWLVLRIQPNEGIALRFNVKIPGSALRLGSVDMDFHYADHSGCKPSTGYERLLYDCMVGDATLFRRADEVEGGWNLITQILDVCSPLSPRQFPNYSRHLRIHRSRPIARALWTPLARNPRRRPA